MLLDLEHYRVIAKLEGHIGRVFSARWVAQDQILTAGSDGTVRLWDGSPVMSTAEDRGSSPTRRYHKTIKSDVIRPGQPASLDEARALVHAHALDKIGSHRGLVGGSRPQCDRHQLDACAA
jgi:WD40 repeat protein